MKDWKGRAERDAALRPHLRKFARDKVRVFLDSVDLALGLGPILLSYEQSEQEKKEIVAHLKRLKGAAELFRRSLGSFMEPALRIHTHESPAKLLSDQIQKMEAAGGIDRLVEKASEEHDNYLRGGEQPPKEARLGLFGKTIAPYFFLGDEDDRRRMAQWRNYRGGRLGEQNGKKHWKADPIQACWEVNTAKDDVEAAVNAWLRELEDAITALRPRGAGRRPTNSMILTQIAHSYLRVFGEVPSTTKGQPFYNISVVLTGQADPERAVRKAIASVRNKTTTK